MTESQFLLRRGEAWKRLEKLLGRAGTGGVRRMNPEEVAELGRLYRWVTSDLAYAQGHRFDGGTLAYLNRLTARAHAQVYRGTAQGGRERIAEFFSERFPAEFRRSFLFVFLCVGLTVLGAVVAYAAISADPDRALALLPQDTIPAHIQKSLHDSNFAFRPDQAATMSAEIITNNIRVAVIAFAGGIVTLGIITIWIILSNGLMVGGMGAVFGQAGFGYDFWATIAPHGVIELLAIQIAGGAGLLIASAILFPGRLRRRDAVREAGVRAGVLIAGVCAMLLVAGTIEGFFSPLRFGPEIRLSVGILTAVGLLFYFTFAGRTTRAPAL
ncbi:MAG: stage II sporulation protein M [Candidatus Baltobacteraceae bacterium]